jgi:hypothetical protein
MKIAGHTAHICSLFESTPQYFRAYLTEEAPEFSVTVTREDIAFEQQDLLEEALREGFRTRTFTDPFLERAAVCRAFGEFLLGRDTLLLHGSAVAVDGEGYLFTADSGTGKSTHTRLWREVFGDRAVMVNDDKPFLKLTEDAVLACGSPWTGKHGIGTNVCVPLGGICILSRGRENIIRPAGAEQVEEFLRGQCFPPQGLEKLLARVRLWEMECTRDPEAAVTAFETMKMG